MDRREQVFRGMQRQSHRGQIDHPSGALERVEGAKDPIDPFEANPSRSTAIRSSVA